MGGYYDEVEIEDMAWDPVKKVYHYPCPCGDRFEIGKSQLRDYEDVATCPSCSLIIRVIYDPLDFEDYEEEEDDGENVSVGRDEDEDSAESGEDGHDSFEDALENLTLDDEPGKPTSDQHVKISGATTTQQPAIRIVG